MQARVIKFGGTSLGDAVRIARAADAVAAARAGSVVAVVVSAMAGVTDRLIDVVADAVIDAPRARVALDRLVDEHRSVARELGIATTREAPWTLDRLHERFIDALRLIGAGDAWASDQLLAGGEKMSAWLLLGALHARNVDAAIVPAEVLVHTRRCGARVEVDHELTYARIRTRGDAFWRPLVRIMPGFTGADAQARTTTLGRNASDYSAALLAAGLGWPLEIWTDVAGCYSADPREVAGARLLRRLSLGDAHRFARAGASVIHARTLEPLFDNPVKLTIVNSFAADVDGTHIGVVDSDVLRGVARRDDLVLVRGAAASAIGESFDRGRDVYADSPAVLLADSHAPVSEALAVCVLSVFDDSLGTALVQRCLRALADAGHVPLALWWSVDENVVRVAIGSAEALVALRVLHRVVIAGSHCTPVSLAVIGAGGRVAGRLLELIAARRQALAQSGVELRVIAIANSRNARVVAEGIAATDIRSTLAKAEALDIGAWSHDLLALSARPLVLLDCTASADVAAHYPQWLAAGIDIVTPNKHAPSADRELARAIAVATAASGARLLHETTVGAQLPLLRTLRELSAAGDRVESLEAVLSGTLSYVLASVRNGVAFSVAMREAVRIGYAEPHPAVDLSGADAARKLVILLRALGIDINVGEVQLTPLVDADRLEEKDGAQLLDHLDELDMQWRRLALEAAAASECWIYRASFVDGIARLAPERIALAHPLARLLPCENALRLRSHYYRDAPLTIAGPGAGIDLTAAGVFADLLDVVAARTATPPMHVRGRCDAGLRDVA